MSVVARLLRTPPVRRFDPGQLAEFLTRASTAWAVDPSSGLLRSYSSNEARIVTSPAGVLSILREPQSTNKCTNYNANPNQAAGTTATTAGSAITNMSVVGDAASVLTIVDDTAALAAAGLSGVCTSGKAYKFDTTGAAANSYVFIGGTAGNTNQHQQTAWVRQTTGSGCRLGWQTSVSGTIFPTAAYARFRTPGDATLVAAPAANSQMVVWATPGMVLYFILNQMEEQAGETSPILTAGSTVTRSRDEIVIPTSVAAGEPFSYVLDFAMPWQQPSNSRLTGGSAIGTDIAAARTVGVWNGTNYLSTANLYTLNARGRVGYSGDYAGRSLVLNGGAVVSDLNQSLALTAMRLGQENPSSDGSAPVLYIHEYRQARRRLSHGELQWHTTA